MKASDLLVRCLENEGVTHVFGIPGEENLDFLESLRTSSIQLVLTRHEQAAAIMAATVGRLTGRTSVALSTLGPGATNLVTGIAYAQLGGMPMLAITGQKPIKKSKQGQFQIIDVVQTMAPITKMAASIPSADKLAVLVREAFRLAEEERPGACHLELAEDIAQETTERLPLKKSISRRPTPDRQAIDAAIRLIQAARHPLIMIAAAANRKRVAQSLVSFINKTRIPFFATQMGKGVVDERHSEYLGTASLTQGDYLHCAIDRADLILSIGHDVTEKPPAILGHNPACPLVHINFYSAEIDEVYNPTLEVVGDIATTMEKLTDRITPQPHWDFVYFHRMREITHFHIMEKSDSDQFPLLPQRVVRDLRLAMPEDGILALDNGMYKIWISRNYPAYQQNTVLLDNALATMGTGLPSAIAAKLVSPQCKVVAICGDGGFMMNSQEMETAVRLGLDLVVVVLNDNGYGMIQWKQEDMGLPAFGLSFGNPDFVRYAESYGAKGWRVEKAEDLLPMLRHALDTPGVHLVEVPIDYRENNAVLSRELREKVCLL
ncbi:MAG: acetolactate synthase large subunit [Magnetococcales bacterium]|nr:acetolactate synthase large subunit [Magnetococcales bacterium]NGZ27415.1 acetolactate synthase large subunit [Magnetococcales bacterium]